MLRSLASRSVASLVILLICIPSTMLAHDTDTSAILEELRESRDDLHTMFEILLFVLRAECEPEDDSLEALHDCLIAQRETEESEGALVIEVVPANAAQCLADQEAWIQKALKEERDLMLPEWAKEAAAYKDQRDTGFASCSTDYPAGKHRDDCETYYETTYQSTMDNHRQRKEKWVQSLETWEREHREAARESCGVE